MINFFRDLILFVLIFSFINDNVMVELFGEFSIKAVFILFLIVNLSDIIKAVTKFPENNIMKSFYFFITIFTIVVLISVLFLGQIDLSYGMIYVVSILVIFTYITYYKAFDKLLYFIWANVFISSIVSLFNEPISEYTFRTSGGTVDPVEFSVHLFMGIFITIYLYNKNKSILFIATSMPLFFYALLYAGSKTAVLTLIVLSLYIIFFRFGHIFKYIFSFKGLIIVSVILGIFFQANLFDKLDAFKGMQERAKTSRTADQRFISWNAGERMIEDHFFAGVGLNQYDEHTKRYLTDYLDKGGYDPHNNFLKIFAEAGIFSFLSFAIFLFFLFKTRFYEVYKSEYFWISLVPLSGVLMGMTINTTYDKHFWLSLALLSHVVYMLDKKNNNEKGV